MRNETPAIYIIIILVSSLFRAVHVRYRYYYYYVNTLTAVTIYKPSGVFAGRFRPIQFNRSAHGFVRTDKHARARARTYITERLVAVDSERIITIADVYRLRYSGAPYRFESFRTDECIVISFVSAT